MDLVIGALIGLMLLGIGALLCVPIKRHFDALDYHQARRHERAYRSMAASWRSLGKEEDAVYFEQEAEAAARRAERLAKGWARR